MNPVFALPPRNRGGRAPVSGRYPPYRWEVSRVLGRAGGRALGVAVLVVAASGCVLTGGGTDLSPKTEPITRPELLRALGEVATTLEGSKATLAGRQEVLNACIEIPRLLDRDTYNPKGIHLRGEDSPFLQFAQDTCAEGPLGAARLIRSVLYDTRPLEGVQEPRCEPDEVELRFAKHGLDSSGEVYLRIELVSRAKDLCVVDGRLSVRLVRGDGQSVEADPWGSDERYRTLPGPGMVQWFRVSYGTSQAYCTGRLVPVRELRVRFPNDGGDRVLNASVLPAPARRFCTDGFLALAEDATFDLDGP